MPGGKGLIPSAGDADIHLDSMENRKETARGNLILIGTVHGDPQGYERAVNLLEFLRPEVVTVEISPFSVRYRAAHQGRWQQLFQAALARLPREAQDHPAIRRVAAQIEMPFEWRAAHDYGRKHGVPWRPVDLSGLARRNLPFYEKELLSLTNLRKLWETRAKPLEEQVAAAYRRARLSETRPLRRLPGGHGGITCLRERVMAARLRKLADQGRRVAHLGGWEHTAIWEDGGGLHKLLEDLKPVRFLLDESDLLAVNLSTFAVQSRRRR